MEYDFAICGAGPVGSYLAWKLSKNYKVLLLEEHEKIGEPLACSGLVSKKIWDFIPQSKGLIEKEMKGARIHLGKNTYTFRSNQAVLINRKKLDKFLAAKAVKGGAELLTEAKLFSFFESKSYVSLYIKSDSFENIRAKILAGCDGPLSVVRNKMGIPSPKFLHGIFSYVDEEPDQFVDLYLKKAPGFFAWRIPRKNNVEYGIASEKNAKKYFEKFMKDMRLPIGKIYSGLIPFGLLNRTTSHRVFLCGDAASQTKPHTGGGIVYGIRAANIASALVKPDKPNLDTYEKEWRKILAGEIKAGLRIKKAYSLPTPILNPILKSLVKKQNLDMDRPSTAF